MHQVATSDTRNVSLGRHNGNTLIKNISSVEVKTHFPALIHKIQKNHVTL